MATSTKRIIEVEIMPLLQRNGLNKWLQLILGQLGQRDDDGCWLKCRTMKFIVGLAW
jgi:hypothetical protein